RVGELAVPLRVVAAAARTATRGEGEHRGTGDNCQWLAPSHTPAFLSEFAPLEGNRGRRLGSRQRQSVVASATGLRVERVTNGVPEEVEREHERDDADHRLPQVERVGLEVGDGIVDRLTPRDAGGDADAQV